MSKKVCECKEKTSYPKNKPATTGNPSGKGRSNNVSKCNSCSCHK